MNLPKLLLLPSLRALALGLAVCAPLAAQENQELGRMWTFENPPLAYLEKEYGFKPDQAWLNSLRLAALRLGGETVTKGFCSASFVSPKGLIMTNNHCVRDAVSATKDAGPGIVKEGFYATSLEDELRLKTPNDGWLTVSQLNKITDVTAEMNAGLTEGDTVARIKEQHEKNEERLLAAAKTESPDLVPQVVSLFQGGQFKLYQYRVYDDVRLVCTPHLQTAHFGGDPDNFTYPRYSIDFAFLRAYENGEPADTALHYYRWKMGGATDNELVFVPGNPGSTDRLNTKAQMDFQRDVKIPIILQLFTNRLRIFRSLIERFPQLGAQFQTQVLGWENAEKALTGNLDGLNDAGLMAQKAAAEKAFRQRVDADAELRAKYGHVWDQLAEVAAARRQHEPRAHFHSAGYLGRMNGAITIVQATDPAEPEKSRKKALESLPELEVIDNIITQSLFLDHVARAGKWLPEGAPYFTSVLGDKPAKEALQTLMSSQVAEDEFRADLVEGGWEAVQASDDPAIVAARALVPLIRADEQKGEELDAKESALGADIGKALFACYGTDVSPDATMTLRFTDGRVKGYPCNGTIAPYRTTFYGLYGRNADFDREHPFDLPAIWHERHDTIDMSKAVNFVSTNDITGGNSGSVVVNQALEVVGLIFDGNIESLHNDFVFRDDIPRSVSVHVDGIMEALKKVYDAERVVTELQGK